MSENRSPAQSIRSNAARNRVSSSFSNNAASKFRTTHNGKGIASVSCGFDHSSPLRKFVSKGVAKCSWRTDKDRTCAAKFIPLSTPIAERFWFFPRSSRIPLRNPCTKSKTCCSDGAPARHWRVAQKLLNVLGALFTKRGNRHLSSSKRSLHRVELSAATRRAQPTQIRASLKRSSSSASRAEMASGWLHSTVLVWGPHGTWRALDTAPGPNVVKEGREATGERHWQPLEFEQCNKQG